MSSRAWNKRPRWSLAPVAPALVALVAALAELAACGSPRTRPQPAAPPPPAPARATPASTPPSAAPTPARPAGATTGDTASVPGGAPGAVAREAGSAVAWTELGATQRLRGEFKDAVSSYEQAIAADPRYAPAWRNLGVLADLYLGDPRRALTAFEQYRQLTGEEKPVSG